MGVSVPLSRCSFVHADSNAPSDGSRGSGVSPAAARLNGFDAFTIKDPL